MSLSALAEPPCLCGGAVRGSGVNEVHPPPFRSGMKGTSLSGHSPLCRGHGCVHGCARGHLTTEKRLFFLYVKPIMGFTSPFRHEEGSSNYLLLNYLKGWMLWIGRGHARVSFPTLSLIPNKGENPRKGNNPRRI